MVLQQASSNEYKNNNTGNRLTTLLFITYLAVIIWIMLFKLGVHFSYMPKRSYNLIPFNRSQVAKVENILNVLIFIPLGVYTGVLFIRWNWVEQIAFFFFCSVLIEVSQYVFRVGAFDVTDIITNTTGGMFGLMIIKAIETLLRSKSKAQRFVNIISLGGTAMIVLLLLLLKLNLLPIRYQ